MTRFHVLHPRTHFRWYRGRWVPPSCFSLPDSFWAVLRAPGPIFFFFALPDPFWAIPRELGLIFMFCTHGLVFDGTEDVGSRLHVLCSQPHFGRYRGRRVQFSCFALPDPFSVVPRASGSVFMFCAPILLFDGI
jgi:hypothetical protein